jgi:hypothetical protein
MSEEQKPQRLPESAEEVIELLQRVFHNRITSDLNDQNSAEQIAHRTIRVAGQQDVIQYLIDLRDYVDDADEES